MRQAVRGVTPDVVTETKRVGGSTYRVPVEVVPAEGKALAIRWSLIACRKRSGRSMALRSSDELMDAARNSGSAILVSLLSTPYAPPSQGGDRG